MYLGQNSIIYPVLNRNIQENELSYRSPSERGIPYKDITLKTEDGFAIKGWLMLQPSAKTTQTVLYFHANAGNRGTRMDCIEQMYKEIGLNVFIIDYRGYGDSEGRPSESALKLDSEASMQYLLSSDEIDPNSIYLFGRSLGGAVAIYGASKFTQTRGLIVENTFTSIPNLLKDAYGWFSYLLIPLLTSRWDSEQAISDVRCPTLFISGRKDETVFPSHMDALYHKYCNPKEFKEVPEGGHNVTWRIAKSSYVEWILSFINST